MLFSFKIIFKLQKCCNDKNIFKNLWFSWTTCRLGIWIREIIDVLNKIKPPFNVNKAALFTASAAVKDSNWLNKEIKHVNNWNKKMFNEFKKMKIETNRSYSNFLLINFNNKKLNLQEFLNC